MLIDHLPPESATKTAIRDGLSAEQWAALPPPAGHGPWARSDYLLAALSDQVSWLTYAVVAVAGGKPKEPRPMDRPGVGAPRWEQQEITAAAQRVTAAHVAYALEHHGASPPPGWTPDLDGTGNGEVDDTDA